MLAALQSPQPPPTEAILTTLLNEIATIPDNFILVLDDYHVIDAKPVDQALTFLVEHLPPQMHLVIATREDPHLPLARLRARGQLTELRAADLRFTPAEAAEFLNQVMGLNLSAEDIAALETRTEGWIAGLQLAAISMQDSHETPPASSNLSPAATISCWTIWLKKSCNSSPKASRLSCCAPPSSTACAARCVTLFWAPLLLPGRKPWNILEHANLFIVPLDNERRWYRYHHLFGDLLRQRLGQSLTPGEIAEYHIRASQWYEDNGLELEAFQHATAANDVERAERLMEGKGMPLHFRGAVNAILEWLASLPKSVLDARPLLWVRSATMALMAGQTTGVEEKLQAAEDALQNADLDRSNPRPDRANCLRQGHVGAHPLPAGNDDHPGAPRPGVSASRESAFPLYG